MRLAASRYTIDRIPEEVARYAAAPATLPVGSPGKVGMLELAFARRGRRTELTGHFQKAPLQIMRPLYYDPHRPDMPYVQVMSAGGGVLQGDRYRLDVTCGARSAVHVTTQAATKIYRMDRDYASQLVNLTVGPGGYLEYLPAALIPYADARFHQRTVLTADPSATVVYGETLLVGRLARGERNRYAAVCSDLEARTPDGRTIFADPIRLVPADGVTGPAVLGEHGVLASLFVLTAAVSADVVADTLHEALAGTGLTAGAGTLPGDAGAWARILGPESPEVAHALHTAWDTARRLLIGVPAPDRGKTW